MGKALRRLNPQDVKRGFDRLGIQNVDDLPIVSQHTISENGLANGFADIGKLDRHGANLGDVSNPNSWIYRAKAEDNPGTLAEARRASEHIDNGDNVLFLGRKGFLLGQNGFNYEIDIVARNRQSNNLIMEEVKNWHGSTYGNQQEIVKIKIQIQHLSYFKQHGFESEIVEKASVVLKQSENIPQVVLDDITQYATARDVSVEFFGGVN